ncbi:MAG: acyltransferase family protein [Reyranellales bacterium]
MAGTGSDLVRPGYRPDIDGLRAVAVLAVVGFHAFPVWVKAGFVGVDIFFVISAYLITTLLLINLRRGQFSYVHFYIRRINRLFPALLLILVVSLVAGWFLLTAFEYKLFGKQIAAASVYVSNLLLWHEAGYFDIESELKPLLHLWSLAVEEQFYLVWPPILAFAWRRKWNLPAMMGAILALSFAADLFELDRNAVATFYSPATRFWELAAGGLLATLEERRIDPLPGVRAKTLLSIAGAALLAVGLATIDSNTPFPDWAALLPCGGAFLLIAAGPTAWLNRHVLARRPLVAIGLISYPLYLWHWPLLSFAHLYDTATPSLLTRTALAVLSFPLAAATWHFVEKPIRFGPRGEQKAGGKKAAVLLGLLLAVGVLGIGIYAKQGFPGRTIVNQKRAPVDRGQGDPVPPCAGRKSLPPELATICASHLNAGAKHRVVLWGDSHAAVWAMPLVRLAKERGFELYVLRHDGCPPIEGVWRPANNASITLCETPDIMRRIEDGIVGLEPDVVVLAARWTLYSHGWVINGRMQKANGFLLDRPASVATEDTSQAALARQIPDSIHRLQARGVRVVVIKNPPVLRWEITNIRKSLAEIQVTAAEHAAWDRFTDGIFARLRDVAIFDPAKDLCHDTCAVERDGKPLYFDDNHLSAVGVNAFKDELGTVIDRELAKGKER